VSEPTHRTWHVDDPFSGGTIAISGWDWAHRADGDDSGDKPIALLSHANGFCGAMWGLVADSLRADYRVVAIDVRGHGDSQAPAIPDGYDWNYFVADLAGVAAQLLQETGRSSIDYGIGNSFGGIVTAAAESRHPGLFQRVAMLDPPIHPSPALLEQLGIDPSPRVPNVIAEQARKRSAVFPSRDFVRDAWRDKTLFASWDPRAFELYVREGFRDRDDGQVELKCNPMVEATIFDTTGSLNVFEFAPRVAAPVLLVRAADGFIEDVVFEHLAALLPNCHLETVDAGHLLPMEAPDLTVELLRGYANGSAV
jgi:pimeloyl-ACP methyl ester carboxylesterase